MYSSASASWTESSARTVGLASMLSVSGRAFNHNLGSSHCAGCGSTALPLLRTLPFCPSATIMVTTFFTGSADAGLFG